MPTFPIFVRVPFFPARAICLWFIVLYVGELRESTRRHETIHFKQWNELWVIGFLPVYLWDFAKALWKIPSYWKANVRIRLEQEAYANDEDPDYLENRKPFAWRDYTV